MDDLKVGDWIYWTEKKKTPENAEPERITYLTEETVFDRGKMLDTLLITTNKGTSIYKHVAYYRKATDEKTKEMDLKNMFKSE